MRYVILLLIGLTVETLPAFADDSDDWPVCNTSEGNSAIAACTRILQRWEASGSDLPPPSRSVCCSARFTTQFGTPPTNSRSPSPTAFCRPKRSTSKPPGISDRLDLA